MCEYVIVLILLEEPRYACWYISSWWLSATCAVLSKTTSMTAVVSGKSLGYAKSTIKLIKIKRDYIIYIILYIILYYQMQQIASIAKTSLFSHQKTLTVHVTKREK